MTDYRLHSVDAPDQTLSDDRRWVRHEPRPCLRIGVGKSEKLASIPLTEDDLLKLISESVAALSRIRKARSSTQPEVSP